MQEAFSQKHHSPATHLPVVLSFAGIDSSGGAGLLAHIQTINRHECYPMGISTLQTVQDTLGVYDVLPCDPIWIKAQAVRAMADIQPDAVLVSAIGSLAVAKTIVEVLSDYERLTGTRLPMVLDTVLRSSSGAALIAPAAIPFFRESLIPIATVITPNVMEFEFLLRHLMDNGSDLRNQLGDTFVNPGDISQANSEWIEEVLKLLSKQLGVAIYLKGGHWAGEPIDRLVDKGVLWNFSSSRLKTQNTHGTGCALAAALACRLAQGIALPEAGKLAHTYVVKAIATAPGLGRGNGPLNLRRPAN